MQRVVLVRHGDGPADDRVVRYLNKAGLEVDIRRPFQGDPLDPSAADIVGSVIYGGMYNAYDTAKHPFLNDEYRWIEACLKADVPLLGICQGAQMIAHHLGAWVGPYDPPYHEYGVYEITPTGADARFLGEPMHVTQAHYHTFDLPEGAVHLARSEAYDNQAFRLGDRVYGFQFHAEVTIDGFRRWQASNADTADKPGAQDRATQDALLTQHDPVQEAWFMRFLAGFLEQRAGP